jgi:hypothetical protein
LGEAETQKSFNMENKSSWSNALRMSQTTTTVRLSGIGAAEIDGFLVKNMR